ncbi:6787_t:CDS:2, partial [Entrophospora sp. SA101]
MVSSTNAVKKSITISKTAYEASEDADAIVITTEWDEFKLTRKEGDDISYAKKSMDIKILDIIGILLMVLPIAIQLPLAAFAGHEADINNIQFAELFFTIHYLIYVVRGFTFIFITAYIWSKIYSLLSGYINCIYKNDSTKNIPSIRRLKTTRKV